jgi:hypothetical protein
VAACYADIVEAVVVLAFRKRGVTILGLHFDRTTKGGSPC